MLRSIDLHLFLLKASLVQKLIYKPVRKQNFPQDGSVRSYKKLIVISMSLTKVFEPQF